MARAAKAAAAEDGARAAAGEDVAREIAALRADVAALAEALRAYGGATAEEVRARVAAGSDEALAEGLRAVRELRGQVEGMEARLEGEVRESPLAWLAGAAVIGVLVGLLLGRRG